MHHLRSHILQRTKTAADSLTFAIQSRDMWRPKERMRVMENLQGWAASGCLMIVYDYRNNGCNHTPNVKIFYDEGESPLSRWGKVKPRTRGKIGYYRFLFPCANSKTRNGAKIVVLLYGHWKGLICGFIFMGVLIGGSRRICCHHVMPEYGHDRRKSRSLSNFTAP